VQTSKLVTERYETVNSNERSLNIMAEEIEETRSVKHKNREFAVKVK
jgi:hypothetical protein